MKRSERILAALVVVALGLAPGNAEGKSDAEYQIGAALGGPGFSWYSAHIDGRHYEAASSGDAYLLSPSLSILGDWVLFKYFELGFRAEFAYPLDRPRRATFTFERWSLQLSDFRYLDWSSS